MQDDKKDKPKDEKKKWMQYSAVYYIYFYGGF